MTPAAIYTAVRDALVAGALIFILVWVHHADTNSARVADDKGVITQLQNNLATQAQWESQREKADEQHAADLASISTRIDAQRDPVLVRIPAPPGPMPGAPAAPASLHPAGGAVDAGPGVDIRPRLNEFEKHYEQALADCREVVGAWPSDPK